MSFDNVTDPDTHVTPSAMGSWIPTPLTRIDPSRWADAPCKPQIRGTETSETSETISEEDALGFYEDLRQATSIRVREDSRALLALDLPEGRYFQWTCAVDENGQLVKVVVYVSRGPGRVPEIADVWVRSPSRPMPPKIAKDITPPHVICRVRWPASGVDRPVVQMPTR